MNFRYAVTFTVISSLITLAASPSWALNGSTLRVNPFNGWRGFEVVTAGDNPADDGVNYALPYTFDGLGARISDAGVLRFYINHENTDANISEVNVNLANFQTAIHNVIGTGSTGGVTFVTSAQQAYSRWTANGGTTWTPTSDVTTTTFYRFCSSQLHFANAFGDARGFADDIYITGEEGSTLRVLALDVANRDFYQVSGYAGNSGEGGIGGMPFDAYENVALLDTGETNHVAILLSPDGGTQTMRLYIGVKGRDTAGNPSTSFLARNGLAFGSYYYLNDTLPASGTSTDGFFDTTSLGALISFKLEDVDTNPNDPSQVVIGVQETGLFTFDFSLDFSSGTFDPITSNFSLTKIQNHNNDLDGLFGDADNVDWTAATTLGGVSYPGGLIFVNEDSGTSNGETWMMQPDGSGLTKIADTAPTDTVTMETSGILDISTLVGYKPGSVLVTSNQGTASSLSVLINPNATLQGDFDGNGTVDAANYVVWRKGLGTYYQQGNYDLWRAQFGQSTLASAAVGSSTAIPEPTTLALFHSAILFLATRRTTKPRPPVAVHVT